MYKNISSNYKCKTYIWKYSLIKMTVINIKTGII